MESWFVEIPGRERLSLRHLVLDLNGTIALDGELLPGVAERVAVLRDQMAVYLLTADTHGRGAITAGRLGIHFHRLTAVAEAEQKADMVRQLGAAHVVALGNGANDALMLAEAALGIAVLGREGLSMAALQAADVVAPDVTAALDLLLNPKRLVATLRR
ncbi:MAG: HAD family hydrolase [Chloroflexota bacterium]